MPRTHPAIIEADISSLDDRESEFRAFLARDLVYYAAGCLFIRTKLGEVKPFVLNSVQRKLHEELERQKTETGRVRAIVLKGRQMGCSTYVSARYYHRAAHRGGLRVFILTHSDQATQNLFDIVDRFHQHLPEHIRPVTGASNAKELSFVELDSGYRVGTAGTRDVGRSATIQLLHGSEVAFWPHAETHAAGVFQAVPNTEGSEIILESTANGFGNLFHAMWEDAIRGMSSYRPVFLPWFWHDEYAQNPGAGFTLSQEDEAYQDAHGLTLEQMAWRQDKIRELKSDLLFRQEFPATASEAFQLSGHDSFIPPALVLKARKTHFGTPPTGPLIIGFDPAWKGGDRHSMALRQGRRVLQVISRRGLSVTESAGWLAHTVRTLKPARAFVDVGGVGAGVYDILEDQGLGEIVRPVNFGASPVFVTGSDTGGPANRRAEMYQNLKDWLEDPAGVSLPDQDDIQADMTVCGYGYDGQSRLLIESKDKIRARNMPSPDTTDAIALTFAEPVVENSRAFLPKRQNQYIV
jgi:hypothetical protein